MLTFDVEFEPGPQQGPTPTGIGLEKMTLEKVAQYMDGEHTKFVAQCQIVHRKSVFQGLIYLIRILNVDTGRLRASFVPFMQKYGFTNWSKYIYSRPIGGKIAGKWPKVTTASLKEGLAQGEFVDQPMNTTIGTNVVYAPYVDARFYFIARLLVWLDKRYNQNFENFLEAAAKNGVIPPQDQNEEGPTQ